MLDAFEILVLSGVRGELGGRGLVWTGAGKFELVPALRELY